jgi:hypothetical protein
MPEKSVKLLKIRAFPSASVYRKVEQAHLPAEDFALPFGGKLAEDNRWVQLAQLISWSEFEQEYAQNFETKMGRPAKSFRLALGALIGSYPAARGTSIYTPHQSSNPAQAARVYMTT